MSDPPSESLHRESLPPIGASLPFFIAAPAALALAGGLLLWQGGAALESHWSPLTIALTHLATLGFVSMIGIGSLYSMIPATTGRPAPSPRLASWVFGLLVLGIAGFVGGLVLQNSRVVFNAIAVIFPGFVLFVVPAFRASRAATDSALRSGLRLAVYSLGLAIVLGLWVAHGHGGMRFPGSRALWLEVHLSVALLGWVGSFALVALRLCHPGCASGLSPSLLRGVHIGTGVGVTVPSILVVCDYFGLLELASPGATTLTSLTIVPAAVAIWGVAPLRILPRLTEDGELALWRVAFGLAPLCGLMGIAAHFSADSRISLAFGWLTVWGWAGMLMHATLRDWPRAIQVGSVASRSHASPEPSSRAAFWLHLGSVASGAAAIGSGSSALAVLTGALLIALAALIAVDVRGTATVRIEA